MQIHVHYDLQLYELPQSQVPSGWVRGEVRLRSSYVGAVATPRR